MFLGQSMADGNQGHDSQADQEDETGEGFWGGDWGPDESKTEACALGATDLLFDGHAAPLVPSAPLLVFLITDLLGHLHQLAAEPAEEVVIFYLLLQSPDLVWIMEPAAEGFSPDLKGIEGVRADQHRDIVDFPFGFKELAGD
mgnify:CR=1 FL=1